MLYIHVLFSKQDPFKNFLSQLFTLKAEELYNNIMDCVTLCKRVDPSLLYALLDPFFYNDLRSKINKQRPKQSTKQQQSASCEDILTMEPPNTQLQVSNESCSLDTILNTTCPIDTTTELFKPVTTINTPKALLSDIINYLMSSLVPCIRTVGSAAVQYNAQCFYGYEAVTALAVYIRSTTAGLGPPFPEDKIPIICSRFLVSGIIKDARKSQNLEFKSSRLYRFSSVYIRNHTQQLLSADEGDHDTSESFTTIQTNSSSTASDQVMDNRIHVQQLTI